MRYALKKISITMILLLIVSLITFGIFQLLPGNPIEIILGVDADPGQVEALRKQLGLDVSLPQRYLHWITNLLRGDMGNSLRYRMPVADMLRRNLPVTVALSVMSLTATILLAVPISIYLAKNNRKKRAVFLSSLSQIGVAIPSFWLGVMLIMLFAVILGWLPSSEFVPFSVNPMEAVKSLILPSAAISAGTVAIVVRYLKNTLLDQLSLNYVRTAKSKGMTENRILYKHVLKNALLPTITILGMIVSDILGGSIIVENVFSLPGIGTLLTAGVGNRDFILVQGLTFYFAFTVIMINLAVDLLSMMIDPRISTNKGK